MLKEVVIRRKEMEILVLFTVFLYAVFCFILVEKMKSTKNIWEPVIENIIILGLMADTS